MKIGFIGLGKMGFNMVQRLLHYGHETVVWNIDPKRKKLEDYVEDSGEGRWTIQAAIDLDVPVPVITASLFSRFQSRQTESFAMKVLAALRNQFGGHAVKSKNQ
ncbi:MAG: NAD(P)-binding domain-containing protein [Mariniphaga sp.]|nr:NAD(P)-binding domain-containing protein [Mariniphaga sp.]